MILVTGASGHVGANLVRHLLSQGKQVRVLIRSDARALEGLEVERISGDLASEEALNEAVAGVDLVFHLAAFVSLRDVDRDRLFEINVLGTRKLLAAAHRAGVKKFVHCSSFGAVGLNPGGGPSDESFSVNPNQVELPYDQSKALAEHEVIKAVVAGLDASIVNPSGIVGPWDFKPSSLGQTTLDFCHRKMPAYVPGRFEFVSVKDVVSGLMAAAERGGRGERYILTNQVHSLDELLGWLEEFTGIMKPRLAIPPKLMEHVAGIKDWFENRLFPQATPRFTRGVIRMLNSGKSGTNEKARRELDWHPTPVRQAVHEQLTWFSEAGLLPEGLVIRALERGERCPATIVSSDPTTSAHRVAS